MIKKSHLVDKKGFMDLEILRQEQSGSKGHPVCGG